MHRLRDVFQQPIDAANRLLLNIKSTIPQWKTNLKTVTKNTRRSPPRRSIQPLRPSTLKNLVVPKVSLRVGRLASAVGSRQGKRPIRKECKGSVCPQNLSKIYQKGSPITNLAMSPRKTCGVPLRTSTTSSRKETSSRLETSRSTSSS